MIPEITHERNGQNILDQVGNLLVESQVPEVVDRRYLIEKPASHEGHAQCVHRFFEERFLYNEAFGWLYHNGTHWTPEGAEAKLSRAIVETLEERKKQSFKVKKIEECRSRLDASELLNDERLEKEWEEQLKSFNAACISNAGTIQGTKSLLQSLAYAGPKEFDNDPDMINCKNGALSLRTGELIPHSTDQRFTHCVNANFNPNADTTFWTKLLFESLDRNEEALEFLRKAVGYSLTGHTREDVLFYIYGPTRAGKGLFTSTVENLLGETLAKSIGFEVLTGKRDGQSFELAELKGTRAVFASESTSSHFLNSAKVKTLTGGDKILCSRKYKDPFNYRPEFKVWLSSNEEAKGDPHDDALWTRIRLIHFPVSNEGKTNKKLREKLSSAEVLDGVLAWAVSGAMDWYKLGNDGLLELTQARKLKEMHRSEIDEVKGWLDDCCEIGDHWTANDEVYSSYKNWCESNGHTPKYKNSLSRALRSKGFAINIAKKVEGRTKKGVDRLKIK